MKKYLVQCTMIYNGNCEVEAETEHDALEYVQEQLCSGDSDDFPNTGKFGIVEFTFGEATADYVEDTADM